MYRLECVDANLGHGVYLCFGAEITPQGMRLRTLGLWEVGPFEEGYGLHDVGFVADFLRASAGSSDREVGFMFGHLEPKVGRVVGS